MIYLWWSHKIKLILDVTPLELFSLWPYSNEKLLPSRNELTLKDLASYLQCLILDWIDHHGCLAITTGKIRQDAVPSKVHHTPGRVSRPHYRDLQ